MPQDTSNSRHAIAPPFISVQTLWFSVSDQFNREPPIRVPQTPSAFHPHAQRNAFRRRDVHLQSSRSPFAIYRRDTAPTPTGFA